MAAKRIVVNKALLLNASTTCCNILKNTTFHQTLHLSFIWILQQTASIFLNGFKLLVLVMNKERVLSEVGTEFSTTGWLKISWWLGGFVLSYWEHLWIQFLLQIVLRFSCIFSRVCKTCFFFRETTQERKDTNRNYVRTDNWDSLNAGWNFL